MPMSYVLDGQESDLKNHVGHRVEVTGTIVGNNGPMNSGSTAAGSSATGATTGGTTATGTTTGSTTGAAGGHGSMAGQLRVSSIRMISSECSGSGR